MKTKEAAEREITRLFREWAKKHGIKSPGQMDAMSFFMYLRKEDSYALNFRCSGDKWQAVKSMLFGRGLITY